MSVTLPGIVADALDILGFTWPNLDEDKIREHARAWKTFAADLEFVISDTDRSARTVAQDNHGESINAFTEHWAGVGGQGDLREAADAANLVGDTLEIFAGIVEGLKYAVIAEASVTAALIVGTGGAALIARGALTTVLRRLKKEAIQEILSRIVPKLSQEAKEQFARILKNPLPNLSGRQPALAGIPDNIPDRAPNMMAMRGGGGRGGRGGSQWDNAEGGNNRPNPDGIYTTPERQRHILDGDPNNPESGGHRYGTGRPGKTEFPERWNDDDTIDYVEDVARAPDRPPRQLPDDNWETRGQRDNVNIRTIVRPDGSIETAHPTSGDGVVRNDSQGRPHPKPF